MSVSLFDVTPSVPKPPLIAVNGSLQPPNGPILANYQLADWGVYGGSWPIGPFTATASLYTSQHQGSTMFLATVIFMNQDLSNTAYAFWKTFRLRLPGDMYDASLDDEICAALKRQLTDPT